MNNNEFYGFNVKATIEKMITFIKEMSHGLTNKYIAELSGLSDRTVRKVINHRCTSLELTTYYTLIEALGKHRGHSSLYMAEKMQQCGGAMIKYRPDNA